MSLSLAAKALVEAAAFTGFDQAVPVIKERQWKSDLVVYDTFVEQRNLIVGQPQRHWYINWEMMDAAARNQVMEIFDAARGRYDTFLWLDDDEYLASSINIVTDGSDTTYQLKCDYYDGETYEWSEDKTDIVPGTIYAPVVTHDIDGAQTEVAANPPVNPNEYHLDDTTGIMTWAAGSPPSAGNLTCTFQYYFRVRFADDTYRDILFQPRLYRGDNLHFIEVKP